MKNLPDSNVEAEQDLPAIGAAVVRAQFIVELSDRRSLAGREVPGRQLGHFFILLAERRHPRSVGRPPERAPLSSAELILEFQSYLWSAADRNHPNGVALDHRDR